MNCTGFALIFVQMTCTTPAPAGDTFCQITKPITWHASDTRKTKEQVDVHNRQWKRLCKK